MKPERGGVLSVRFRSFSRLFRKTTIVSNLCVCVGGGGQVGDMYCLNVFNALRMIVSNVIITVP